MVEEVEKILINELGVSRNLIKQDKFPGFSDDLLLVEKP